MAAFVRDSFVTLIQIFSLNLENKARQQSMLIALVTMLIDTLGYVVGNYLGTVVVIVSGL